MSAVLRIVHKGADPMSAHDKCAHVLVLNPKP